MVTGAIKVFSCATNFLNGRKCVFCGLFKAVKIARSYVRCQLCLRQKNLSKLHRDIAILQGFYQQQPEYRLASDLGLDTKTITWMYQRLRIVLFHTAELKGAKLSGEIEMDESYFGRCSEVAARPGRQRQKHRPRPSGARWEGYIPRRLNRSRCRPF